LALSLFTSPTLRVSDLCVGLVQRLLLVFCFSPPLSSFPRGFFFFRLFFFFFGDRKQNLSHSLLPLSSPFPFFFLFLILQVPVFPFSHPEKVVSGFSYVVFLGGWIFPGSFFATTRHLPTLFCRLFSRPLVSCRLMCHLWVFFCPQPFTPRRFASRVPWTLFFSFFSPLLYQLRAFSFFSCHCLSSWPSPLEVHS